MCNYCQQLFKPRGLKGHQNACTAKRLPIKFGQSVSLIINWSVTVAYNFASLTRGGLVDDLVTVGGTDKRFDFNSIPRNWQEIVRSNVTGLALDKAEDVIAKKHDLYGSFKSWRVRISIRSILLTNIRVIDRDTVFLGDFGE